MWRGQTHPPPPPPSWPPPRHLAGGSTPPAAFFRRLWLGKTAGEPESSPGSLPLRLFPKIHRLPCEPPVHPWGRSTGHAWRPSPMTTMHAPRVSTCLPIPESPEPTRMNRQRVEAIRKPCPPKGRQQPIACRTANRREGQDSLGRTESRPSTGGATHHCAACRGGRGLSPQGALGAPLRVLVKKPESFGQIIFHDTIE